MIFTGFIYALGATLGWAIGAFPLTNAARQLPVTSLNHLRLLLATIILFILSVIIEGGSFLAIFSATYQSAWLWLGLSGATALLVGDLFSFRSYAILGPQHGTVLTTLSPAAALLAGIILINEHVNYIGVIGMAITIVGVMSISLGRSQRSSIPDHGHGSVLKGILFGIIAACCHGSGLAFSKKGFIEQAEINATLGPLSASFIRIAIAMLLLFIISLMMGKTKKAFQQIASSRPAMKNVIVGTVFNPVMSGTFSMLAILYINVAVAQTIFSLVPLFSLIIAFVFYKEKITSRSIAGVIAALIGVALLVWRNRIVDFF